MSNGGCGCEINLGDLSPKAEHKRRCFAVGVKRNKESAGRGSSGDLMPPDGLFLELGS